MLSTTVTLPWVKNVYSMGIVGGKSQGNLYTDTYQFTHFMYKVVVKSSTFHHFINTKAPYLFTRYFKKFNLLIPHLYTLSTAPTITKTKEKKERNS